MGALVFLALVALASGAANDNSTSLASNEKSSPIIIVSNNSTLPTSQAESSLNTTGEGTNSDDSTMDESTDPFTEPSVDPNEGSSNASSSVNRTTESLVAVHTSTESTALANEMAAESSANIIGEETGGANRTENAVTLAIMDSTTAPSMDHTDSLLNESMNRTGESLMTTDSTTLAKEVVSVPFVNSTGEEPSPLSDNNATTLAMHQSTAAPSTQPTVVSPNESVNRTDKPLSSSTMTPDPTDLPSTESSSVSQTKMTIESTTLPNEMASMPKNTGEETSDVNGTENVVTFAMHGSTIASSSTAPTETPLNKSGSLNLTEEHLDVDEETALTDEEIAENSIDNTGEPATSTVRIPEENATVTLVMRDDSTVAPFTESISVTESLVIENNRTDSTTLAIEATAEPSANVTGGDPSDVNRTESVMTFAMRGSTTNPLMAPTNSSEEAAPEPAGTMHTSSERQGKAIIGDASGMMMGNETEPEAESTPASSGAIVQSGKTAPTKIRILRNQSSSSDGEPEKANNGSDVTSTELSDDEPTANSTDEQTAIPHAIKADMCVDEAASRKKCNEISHTSDKRNCLAALAAKLRICNAPTASSLATTHTLSIMLTSLALPLVILV